MNLPADLRAAERDRPSDDPHNINPDRSGIAACKFDPLDGVGPLGRTGLRESLMCSHYQGRNGGNLPKRMVIHKTTAFKEAEIEGAFDALAGVAEKECVEVSSASCWRGVWLIKSGVEKPPSKPSGFPVPRGTMVARTGNSALVWVAGNAPEVSTKGDYYQGKKSIPRPL